MDYTNTYYKNLFNNDTILKSKDNNPCYLKYRREWFENPLNCHVSNFPLEVVIELTNACNLSCKHCARTNSNWGPEEIGFMDINIIKKILHEVKDEKGYSVKFSFRGEPMLYDNLPLVLQKAKEISLVDYYFNTNAVLLTEEISKMMIQEQLPRISISVGGWDKESFEKIQKGACFEDVVNNIKNLRKLRKNMNSEFPKIRLQTVLNEETKEHILSFKQLWKDLADELGGIEFREETQVFANSDISNFKCEFLWQRMVVLWDGTVYPCLFLGVKDCEDLKLGNIKYNAIKELWHSTKLNQLRQFHTNSSSHKCTSCLMCSFRKTEINKVN